jgi:hypothetical protein
MELHQDFPFVEMRLKVMPYPLKGQNHEKEYASVQSCHVSHNGVVSYKRKRFNLVRCDPSDRSRR